VIEPLLSEQWFVKTQPLAAPAIEAVEKGRTKFVPELWTKTYMHWMTNIKDWCISRQLWWGHRIPAWYCPDGHITVTRTDPTACATCGAAALRQEEDVLDTWFSSALWPFSTLGWPEKTRALSTFYPNSVLVTAPDIIFFWVARMMMMGLHFVGKVPFRHVYLTPIVTDEKGEKMAKTKGNVLDPLDIVHGASIEALVERAEREMLPPEAVKSIKKTFAKGITGTGSDALRFSLAALTMPGRNIRLSLERVEGYRHFINKLWNASRFALLNLADYDPERFGEVLARGPAAAEGKLGFADRWILSRLQQVTIDVDQALESFRFSDAANALYHFVWGELCDWYIELCKANLYVSDLKDADSVLRRVLTQGTLATVLEMTLRLLHPFTPYVTEEIWQQLPKPSSLPGSLMITLYPKRDDRFVDAEVERQMAQLQEITVAIRMLRSTYNVPPSWSIPVELRVADDGKRGLIERQRAVIENAGRVTLTIASGGGPVQQAAKTVVGADVEVVVPLAGLVDAAAERARIERDIGKADKDIASMEKKLANQEFISRAPEEVIEKDRARLAEDKERRQRLTEALHVLEVLQ
jgi:valyl-tRNA synthetase